MSNANPIPTPETLLHQVARWLSLHMGINAAPVYVAGSGGFPRGVGFADPVLGNDSGGREFTGRELLWHGALPERRLRSSTTGGSGGGGGTGGWVGLTAEPAPSPASGIDVPSRVIAVRLWCEAQTRERAVEVLADAARVFKVPGYSSDGRAFVYARAGMSAEALAAVGGTMLGLIGLPSPGAVVGLGAVPAWRVISVSEFAPIQVVSDAIGAAGIASMPGAAGLVAASMTLAFTVVPASVLTPTLAFSASIGVGDAALGNDAAVRVFRDAAGVVKVEGATFVASGSAHGYQTFTHATVGGIASAMSVAGWDITQTNAGGLARASADLWLMDWRRARTTTGTGAGVVTASVYVHGTVGGGGGVGS